MNIALLSREYPPLTHVGGIGTYTATAARLLADHGHAVHVVCNGPDTTEALENGVRVHRVRMQNHPLPAAGWLYRYRRWFRAHLPNYLDALTWSHTAAAYLRSHAPAWNLDALEFPETNGEGACLDLSAGLSRTHRVARIHTSWIPEYVAGGWEARRLLRWQRRACARAHTVVSPSRFMAENYARRVLRWNRTVQVNPNPVRLWKAPLHWSDKNPRHLLFVGRVEYRKGLDLLLAALEALGSAGEGLVLRVVGPQHPPRHAVDAACQEALALALAAHGPGLRSGYSLEYAGACEHADLHQHFDWAGIAVLPSRQDNYPYTALEALSRGCWLLASDAGGLPEILQGCRGAIFPAGDKDALAGKMRELAQGADRVRNSWLPNARAMAERFHPEACYRRLFATYAGANGTGARRTGAVSNE